MIAKNGFERKKIFFIDNVRIPSRRAASVNVMKTSEAFAAAGHDIELFVPTRIQSKEMREVKHLWSFYNVQERFKIHRIPCVDLMFAYPFLPKPVHLAIFHIQNFTFSLFALIPMIFRRADIYFTRSPVFLLLFSLFFKHRLHRTIFESHIFPKKRFLIRRHIRSIKNIAGIVALNNYMKENYVREAIAPSKIIIFPSGFDEKLYQLKETKGELRRILKIPSNKIILCYSGSLFRYKGVYAMAMAMLCLPDEYLLYVIGGMKNDIGAYKSFIEKENIKNIVVTGHKPLTELPKYLKAADIFILPTNREHSLSTFYESPMKMFEYMISKRPIVASDIPSIKEILDDDTAFLFQPDDPKSIAQKILEATENKELAAKKVENAYNKVKQFTMEKKVRRILSTENGRAKILG